MRETREHDLAEEALLRRFRVLVKRGTHPTTSLTMRCFDVLGVDQQEVESLCGLARGLSIQVRPCPDPLSESARAVLIEQRRALLFPAAATTPDDWQAVADREIGKALAQLR